jgi:hypothetical protein
MAWIERGISLTPLKSGCFSRAMALIDFIMGGHSMERAMVVFRAFPFGSRFIGSKRKYEDTIFVFKACCCGTHPSQMWLLR